MKFNTGGRMFPITALVVIVLLGWISYLFKQTVDPDMGLFTRTRQKAVLSRIINWAAVYLILVMVWWFWYPIQRFIHQSPQERPVERLIEQHRPK